MKLRSVFNLSLTLVCVGALLSACGKKTDDTSATLVTVNGEHITQDQLDFATKAIAAARPGASAPASAQVLQSLVEQRLAVQKAEKDKLDRNPGVLQALEEARKDALARYYLEQFVTKVPKPTDDEIKQYYQDHPANFSQRGIYTLQKAEARVPADQVKALVESVQATTSAQAVVDLLKSKTAAVNVTQSAQPAESLGPLLPKISTMAAGQSVAVPQPQGLVVLTVISSQGQPVTLAQAQPSIEQFLWNQKKRLALQAETKELRDKAKVTYLGKFAEAGTAPAPAASGAAPEAASAASN